MKANVHLRLAVLALPLIAAACAAPRVVTQTPVVVAPPKPAPLPPRPAPVADWRDAPQTPGSWRWALNDGQSTALFVGYDGRPVAVLQCLRGKTAVNLGRAAAGSPPAMVVIRTTGAAPRTLTSKESPAPDGWIGVDLAPRDPLLDAIAFSRGRFALEAAGTPTLYLPARPELSRVIEDCR